jgi:hypothetical protein
MYPRAPCAERSSDAVADAAGTANHQNLLAAEIQFVHRLASPLILVV